MRQPRHSRRNRSKRAMVVASGLAAGSLVVSFSATSGAAGANEKSQITVAEVIYLLQGAGLEIPGALQVASMGASAQDVLPAEDWDRLVGIWKRAGSPSMDFSDANPQREVEIRTVLDEARKTGDYAGSWYDASSDTLFVSLTGDSVIRADHKLSISVETVPARWTEDELIAEMRAIREDVDRAGISADISLDERSNAIDVVVENGRSELALQAVDAGAKKRGEVPSANIRQGQLFSPEAVLQGGQAVTFGFAGSGVENGGVCTSGFIYQSAYGKAFSTAAHCNNGTGSIQGSTSGTAYSEAYYQRYDRQFHPVGTGNDGTNRVNISVTPGYRDITGFMVNSAIYVGMPISKQGRATGFTSGTITDTCVDVGYLPGFGCSLQHNYSSCGGDSGGPVMQNNTAVAMHIAGICGTTSVSMPAEYIPDGTGWTLYTGK